MKTTCKDLGDYSYEIVKRDGLGGGLALLWQPEWQVQVVTSSTGHIDAFVTPSTLPSFRSTGFYGNPYSGLRNHSWELLRKLAGSFSCPWICMGDFNKLLSVTEKTGTTNRSVTHMEAFQQALDDYGLFDINFKGFPFTWRRGKDRNCVLYVGAFGQRSTL